MLRRCGVLLMVFAPLLALGQKSSDADKEKITQIEQTFAAIDNFSSPQATDAMQKYLLDGTTSAVGQFGRLFRMSKDKVVEMTKKPDPTDPDARTKSTISDLQVDVFGDAALASYKLMNTESGHKEAAMNGDFTMTCLDSFAKRKGQWYVFGTACVPAAPLSQAQWDAVMKMRAAEKQQ